MLVGWFRGQFPRPPYVHFGIPARAAEDEVRISYLSPEQSVSPFPSLPFPSLPFPFLSLTPPLPPLSNTQPPGTVYATGEVCISILHLPEDDKYGFESASERWSPVQTPETILLSVISMLSSPNDESPANVEAARLWREDGREFKRRVRGCVRESLGEGC